MGATPQPVLWFEDIRRDHTDVAGGKGANLGELIAAGIPVPPGFVVTTRAYNSYLQEANLTVKLADLLDGIDVNDSGALDAAAADARGLITDADAPSCAEAVLSAYDRLGGGLVAVRSSATAEDTAEASFAGQQSTYLNVEGNEPLIDAVLACWASLFEPRAIHYRARCGIAQTSVSIAVPVQRMVQSDRAGVAFSCDPISGSGDAIVIEAVRGLGEALVSGEVTPDMYVVDKATLGVVDRTVVDQQREFAYAGAGAPEPNIWRDLPFAERARPKLSDDEIARLAAIVRRVEEHYRHPQDIEWAAAGGEFYILQARPITTLQHTH